jgi:hypothetical protein
MGITKGAVNRDQEAELGKLAVLQGLCTPEQVEECLRLQSSSRSSAPLGDLLLFKGYLTAPQLEELRGGRRKKVMACPRCALSYTVFTRSDGRSAHCPKCQGSLVDRAPESRMGTGGEITTSRMRVPSSGSSAPAGERKVTMTCVICDSPFQGALDASGRVRCPACGSTFSPKADNP